MCARFFIASRAVDLPRQKQTGNFPGFKAALQLTRIDEIIFNRISGLQHSGRFKPRYGLQYVELHIFRKRCRNAVWINGIVVQPFRLEEYLVAVTVAELDNLIFHRGAVTGTNALDRTRIHSRTMQIGPNDSVGFLRCAGNATINLRCGDPIRHERERHRLLIGGLHVKALPINSTPIQSWRRACLETPKRKAERGQAFGKTKRWLFAHAASRNLLFPNMDQPIQERAGRQHHSAT